MAETHQTPRPILRRAVTAVTAAVVVAGCTTGVETVDAAATSSTRAPTIGATSTSSPGTTSVAPKTSTSSPSPKASTTTTGPASAEPSDDSRPPAAGKSGAHAVVRVADDDLLNVREQPGPNADSAGGFTPFQIGVSLTGEETDVGDQRWVEVDGGTGIDLDGWVNAQFLVPVQGDTDQTFWFYRDASIYRELLSALPNAQRLGEQIEVVDPNGEVVVSADGFFEDDDPVLSVADLNGAGTSSDSDRTWGSDAGTGEPITATIEAFFADLASDPSLTQTEALAIDQRITFGNTLDNAQEFFPDGVVVELHHAGDEADSYLSWRTTRMVLEKISQADEVGNGPPGMTPEQDWQLVGLAFDSWTP